MAGLSFASLPPDSYFVGPDSFDLSEIRTISGQDPDTIIPVFLPISPPSLTMFPSDSFLSFSPLLQ